METHNYFVTSVKDHTGVTDASRLSSRPKEYSPCLTSSIQQSAEKHSFYTTFTPDVDYGHDDITTTGGHIDQKQTAK